MAMVTTQKQAYDEVLYEVGRRPVESWGDLARVAHSLQGQYQDSAQLLSRRSLDSKDVQMVSELVDITGAAYLGAMVAEREARSGDFTPRKLRQRLDEALLLGIIPQQFVQVARLMTKQEKDTLPRNVVPLFSAPEPEQHQRHVPVMLDAVRAFETRAAAHSSFARQKKALLLPGTRTLLDLVAREVRDLTPSARAAITHVCQQTAMPS